MWTWYFYKGKKKKEVLCPRPVIPKFPCYLQSETARDIASENLLAHLPLQMRDYIYRIHSCKESC